jgi:hypothetical protein
MKRYAWPLVVALFVLGFVAMLSVTTVMAQEETIRGVVTQDNEIETEDGELYAIDSNELGEELKALVGKKVEATGSVLEGMYGGYTITVTSYKQIE